MPRPASPANLEEAVRGAMEGVVRRASADIARAIADLAAAQLERELGRGARVGRARGRGRAVRGRPGRGRGEIMKWVADRRARRVPNFVIDLTGMKTKKQIVAKYGADAAFEKGKAAPKVR
ncbi:MAG TPA: hypothetical protein VLU43_12425 [Anaeromyxobacteraceae bacterium]|nr:hypothetical protein [Anaeromyxobacteraceae bacterium]